MARIKYVPPGTGGSSLRIQPRSEPIACRLEEEEALRKRGVSKSTRARLVFPMTRIAKRLKTEGYYTRGVLQSASVYLAYVLGFLARELLKLAGGFAIEGQKPRIEPRHILQAVKRNDEFSKLLGLADHGGVVPRKPKRWKPSCE